VRHSFIEVSRVAAVAVGDSQVGERVGLCSIGGDGKGRVGGARSSRRNGRVEDCFNGIGVP
jgi:hypothetical protein